MVTNCAKVMLAFLASAAVAANVGRSVGRPKTKGQHVNAVRLELAQAAASSAGGAELLAYAF
jgi:hypothetical protein